MKKYIEVGGILLIAVVIFSGCSESNDEIGQLRSIVESNSTIETPGRPSEINGIITSIDGNKIVIANEIGLEILSEEERLQRKEERQKMTQEERKAIRESEAESVEIEAITIEIPAGVVISKGSGVGSSDGVGVKASFSDIKEGSYISIWKNQNGIELVKLKGL